MTAPDLLPQAACAAPGCRRGPGDTLLCDGHYKALDRTLSDLERDLAGATEIKLGGWSTGHTSGGPLASERDAMNFRLLDAQRQAPPVLEAWAVWLASKREGVVRYGGVEGDRALLAFDLDWIARQPEVTQFWIQVRSLWASLRGHLPVRQCTCGGPVWSERGGAWCSWCSAHWAGSDLLRLNRPREVA